MDEVREKAVVVSGLRTVLVHIRVAPGGGERWWKEWGHVQCVLKVDLAIR